MAEPLYAALTAWIESTLSRQLPEGIAAFHFNLYDGPIAHDLELIGAPTYDPNDSDWACYDIFMSPSPRFELPHEIVGANWEAGLAAARRMLLQYLDTDQPDSIRLKASQAVSLGFVDGELQLLWTAT